MILRGRTMFDPTTRVVDGADPYKLKPQYSQKKKSDALLAFSFAEAGAKEKAFKKKSAIFLSRISPRIYTLLERTSASYFFTSSNQP